MYHPTLVDIGIGNIKLSTAITLLNQYSAENPNSDPLGIKSFSNDYRNLAEKLSNPKDSTTFTFAALMLKQGDNLFAAESPAAWSAYSPSYKDAILITYYNLGKERVEDNINNFRLTNPNAEYRPQSGDGGNDHLKNLVILEKSLNANQFLLNDSGIFLLDNKNKMTVKLAESASSLLSNAAKLSIAQTSAQMSAAKISIFDNDNQNIASYYNQSLVQKNFTSLGINTSNFNVANNSFANYTFIDTSLKFDTSQFTLAGYSPDSSSLAIPNFTLSNPMQDAIRYLGNAQNHASPLSIDLDNDGIETSHAYETNVFFDIKNSGFVNRVGWIKSDDGMLALDRNGNSNIDNVTELFGDYRMSAWDELALLDSNRNNKIDAQDAEFNNLKIWRDLNQNGVSEEGELGSLASHNIKEISLAKTALDQYQNENYISGKSAITYTDNSAAQNIYDVHFLNDNANTWFKGSQSEQFGNGFEVKIEALLLPLSRGYGDMPALHIAMSKDDVLLQMVTELSTLDKARIGEISQLLENILYRWAGVDATNPDALSEADGSNIDARKLKFIEKFAGVEWEQLGNRYVVGHFASLDIKKAWDGIFSEMTNRFLVQGPLADIFSEATYDFATDKISLNTNYQNLIQKIRDFNVDDVNFASEIAHILYLNKTELGINFAQINADLSGIFNQNFGISDEAIKINWGTDIYYSDMEKGNVQINEDDTILKKVFTDSAETINASNIGDYIFAKGGNDVVNGGSNEDYIAGGAGNDTIYGNADNDWLLGEEGDDAIYGGAGRDKITGGAGNDRLYGEDGDDTINGGAGADVIDGGAGNDAITYYDSATGININLKTNIATGGDAAGDTFTDIENVHGSLYADIITGNDQNNFLHGENGNDKIYGEGGDDHLFNGIGTSELYGGDGSDILDAYDGASDLLDGGAGVDTVRYNRPDIQTRLTINLEQGGAVHVDRPKITTYQINNYYLVILSKDLFLYLDSNGQQGVTPVLDTDFLNMNSAFRTANGNNFYMVQYQPVALQTSRQIDANDVLRNIENVEGGYYADNITGNAQDNMISGNGGADIVNGGAGNDILFGDVKNDAIEATDYTNAFESDQISGGLGDDIINGGFGNDILFGNEGNDQLNGGVDNDQITGGAGNDIINGGAGSDIAIYSGRQNDYTITEDQNGWIVTHKNGGIDGVDYLRKVEAMQFSDGTIAINKLPIALDILSATSEDNAVTIDVLTSAADVDGDALAISQAGNAAHGNVSVITDTSGKQKILYTPNANYNGADQFTYTISDGRGGATTATINVNVAAINDRPVASATTATVNEDNSIIIDILANASDVDGDQLTIAATTNPAHGKVSVITDTSGKQKILYTPTTNYNGEDQFTYTISDGHGEFITQTANIIVNSVNDLPRVKSIAPVILRENKSIILNPLNAATDIDGDTLSISSAILKTTGNIKATLSVITDTGGRPKLLYTPNANENGADKIEYTISDGNGGLITKTVDVWIIPVNATINGTAASDSLSGDNANDMINGNDGDDTLLGNAGNDELQGENGADTLIGGAGDDVLTGGADTDRYIFNAGSGQDTITDNDGLILIDQTANDKAIRGIATRIGNSNDFVLQDQNNTGQQYQLNLIGNILTIRHHLSDSIIIKNFHDNTFGIDLNYNPTATTLLPIVMRENKSIIIDVLASASDFDGDALSISSAELDIKHDIKATLSVITDSDGIQKLLYTPNANRNGPDRIKYTISDGHGGFVTKIVCVWITPVNNPINGTAAANTLNGNAGNDMIDGKDGDDIVNGNAGDDELHGSNGADQLNGGAGVDFIYGENGADRLTGDAGADQFIYTAITDSTSTTLDLILDFVRGEDKIKLSGLGFSSISQGLGSNGLAHGLEFYFDGNGNTIIDDPNSDFALKLSGEIGLGNSDFVM